MSRRNATKRNRKNVLLKNLINGIFKFKDKFSLPIVFLIILLLVYLVSHNLSYTENGKEIVDSSQQKEDDYGDKNDTNSLESSDENNITDEMKNNNDIINKKDPSGNSIVDKKVTFNQTKPSNLINDNRGVPVLYYHSVKESADNEVTIKPETLRAELKYIQDQGYITLTMRQLKDYILNNSPIPEKSILITFDDGYMDNYDSAFPILKEFNMTATIFYITSQLTDSYYLSKEAIKEMSDYGIDIESHTISHPHLNKLDYDKQLNELIQSKKTLEEITGKETISIAYPFGDLNSNSVKAAKEAGYTLGFTTKLGLSDRNDNPLTLDRIYISSQYDMNTFKELLSKTKK